jgi:hypothetical protein
MAGMSSAQLQMALSNPCARFLFICSGFVDAVSVEGAGFAEIAGRIMHPCELIQVNAERPARREAGAE